MLALALRSLKAHPARNGLTLFSVALAMALMTFVIAAQLRALETAALIKGRNTMLVMPKAVPAPLSAKSKIEELPGIKRVLSMYIVDDTVTSDKRHRMILHATDADYMTISDSWFHVPQEGIDAWEKERTGAIVARNTASELGVKPGDRLTLTTKFGPIQIVVSAISDKGYKSTGVLVHYPYFAELFGKQNKSNMFWVELDKGAEINHLAEQVDQMFKNTEAPTVTMSSAAFITSSVQASQVIPTLISGAGLIILLATFLVTANTIAINIRERLPELATLRAIGFRRRRILLLLVSEVMILCLLGGLLGSVLPTLIFRSGVKLGLGPMIVGKVDLPPTLALYGLAVSAALALAASIYPAWQAARSDVAAALRGPI